MLWVSLKMESHWAKLLNLPKAWVTLNQVLLHFIFVINQYNHALLHLSRIDLEKKERKSNPLSLFNYWTRLGFLNFLVILILLIFEHCNELTLGIILSFFHFDNLLIFCECHFDDLCLVCLLMSLVFVCLNKCMHIIFYHLSPLFLLF